MSFSSGLLLFAAKFIPVMGGIKKVGRSNILKNSCREKIFDLIRSRPGIYFSEISRETGINRGTARYHVDILEKENLIVSYNTKGKVRFFMKNSTYDEKEMKLISILKNDISRKIICEILRCQPVNNNSLAEKLGVSASTVSWHVKYLKEQGIILISKHGKNNIYNIGHDYCHIIKDADHDWFGT